eukprot:1515069-Rhodomonas_salina.2
MSGTGNGYAVFSQSKKAACTNDPTTKPPPETHSVSPRRNQSTRTHRVVSVQFVPDTQLCVVDFALRFAQRVPEIPPMAYGSTTCSPSLFQYRASHSKIACVGTGHRIAA